MSREDEQNGHSLIGVKGYVGCLRGDKELEGFLFTFLLAAASVLEACISATAGRSRRGLKG